MPAYDAGDSRVLHFGHGDIHTKCARNGATGKVQAFGFDVGTPGEVGRWSFGPPDGEQWPTPVWMVFESIEAVNAVIDSLCMFRDEMAKDQEKSHANG